MDLLQRGAERPSEVDIARRPQQQLHAALAPKEAAVPRVQPTDDDPQTREIVRQE